MDVLVLGGTAWLGREVTAQALERGHAVTCLARGESGQPPPSARLVVADRESSEAYDRVSGRAWDAVIDLASQPGMVRGALSALGDRVRHWTFVSSINVYRSHSALNADESADLLSAADADHVDLPQYGQGKVACELACRASVAGQLLIARPGLIGGPGDATDRSGYWVARAAREPAAELLVPTAGHLTQVIDVRDLASWLVRCSEAGVTGTFDVVGPVLSLHDWIAESRAVAGHTGRLVSADPDWLLAQGVREWMGSESLPLWFVEPGWEGASARSGQKALSNGLRHRPRRELLEDLLAWEREQGIERPRAAGLSAARERELLAALQRARASDTAAS